MPDAKITNKPTGKIWHGPKLCKRTRSVEGETAGSSLFEKYACGVKRCWYAIPVRTITKNTAAAI
jgi:hypothetical protein